jgi:hypothetical protein
MKIKPQNADGTLMYLVNYSPLQWFQGAKKR